MRRAVLSSVILIVGVQFATAALPDPPNAQSATSLAAKLDFKRRVLANGLEVYTMPDARSAAVTLQVYYKVGSKDDPQGRTGLAHLIEHLMIRIARQPASGLGQELLAELGERGNASTYFGHTNYHTIVGANQLEALVWLESKRMSVLAVDETALHAERDVVKEEWRQRVFSRPYGRIPYVLLPQYIYTSHPYARPTSLEDLDRTTLDDVRAFHEAYYRPDNAALVVCGNFDEQRLHAWVDRYFGAVPRPDRPVPRVNAAEAERKTPRSVTAYAANVPLPAIVYGYHAPRMDDPDTAPMVLLETLLAQGRSSRLHRTLVRDKQLARDVSLSNLLAADGGVFAPIVVLADKVSIRDAEAALSAEIARLRDEPVSEDELRRAKRLRQTANLTTHETLLGRTFLLGFGLTEAGDPMWADKHTAAIQSATVADLQRVARRYLADHRRVSIRYLPEADRPRDAGEDPPTASPASLGSIIPAATRPSKPFIAAGEVLPQLGAAPRIEPPAIAEQVLSNGLRVIVARSSDVPLVTAALVIRAGSATDSAERAGVAEITAALLTRGSANRSATEIAAEIENRGATFAATAHRDGTIVRVTTPLTDITAVAAILADAVLNPTFAPEEFARERQQQLDTLKFKLAQVGEAASRIVDPLMYGPPYGTASSVSSINAITREDIVRQHRVWWRPDNAALVLAGAIEPSAAFALGERLFGGWKAPTVAILPRALPTTRAVPGVVVVDLPGASQASVVALLPAGGRQSAVHQNVRIAAAILGGGIRGRLFQQIVFDRGLSYGAYSFLDRPGRILTSVAQTKNESAAEVARVMLAEIDRLADEPVSMAVINSRIGFLQAELHEQTETTSALAAYLAGLVLDDVPISAALHSINDLAAVTPGSIRATLQSAHLRSKHATLLFVGSAREFTGEIREQFPKVEMIPIDELDLSRRDLRKRR